jgi:hypothetical protein
LPLSFAKEVNGRIIVPVQQEVYELISLAQVEDVGSLQEISCAVAHPAQGLFIGGG